MLRRAITRRVGCRTRRSSDPFNDAYIALGAAAERFERGLVSRAVMRGDCLRDAVELDDNRALIQPRLVSLGRHSAREVAAARALHRRKGELCVLLQRFLIRDGVVTEKLSRSWPWSPPPAA